MPAFHFHADHRTICPLTLDLLAGRQSSGTHRENSLPFVLSLKEHQLWGKKMKKNGEHFPVGLLSSASIIPSSPCLLVLQFPPRFYAFKLPRSPWIICQVQLYFPSKPISYSSFSAAIMLRLFPPAYPSEFKFTANVGTYLQLEFCSPKWIVMLSRTTV